MVILALLAAANLQAQTIFLSTLRNFTGDPNSHTNNPDGSYPFTLFPGQNNWIYGVTFGGGDTNIVQSAQSGGVLFKIRGDGTGYAVLRPFAFRQTGTQYPSLKNFNTGQGAIALIQGSDGWLFGTLEWGSLQGGNTPGLGMIFKCDTDGNNYTNLHVFTSSTDGYPTSLIQGRDGALYGTSDSVVFTLDTRGGNYHVLHDFASTTNDGVFPMGALLQAADGALYGTCWANYSGAPGGNIYKITTNGVYSILHTFPSTNNDGVAPAAGLMQGGDGALYGTTLYGGAVGFGTVYKINTNGTGYQILHHFANTNVYVSDGQYPCGSLVQAPASLGGMLLGTTVGGTNYDSNGTIFGLYPDGSGYTVLYNFTNSANGINPYAGLIAGPGGSANGLFYGTATKGGSGGVGTLFSLVMPNPPLSITPVTSQGAGGQTIVYWPTWANGYTLQVSTNLSSSNWTTVTDAVPVQAVQVSNTAPTVFYRLIHP